MLDTVDIEYVGDPPVLDEITKIRIQMGEIHPKAATIMRAAEAQRLTAIKGIDKRVVDPEWFQTSRQYVFGPDNFVVAVEKDDADKILGSVDEHQFHRVGDPVNEIIRPSGNILMVSEIEGRSLTDIGL
jgi:hypothetical protein